jgi:hypothetical protein
MGRGPEEVSQGFPRGDAREHRVWNNPLMYCSIRFTILVVVDFVMQNQG